MPWQHSSEGAMLVLQFHALTPKILITWSKQNGQSLQHPATSSWISLLMSTGGHSQHDWHHFTHGLNNRAQLGSSDYYVTQHHPRRPCSHHPSPPTPPPSCAPLAICRNRCIERQERSNADTACRNVCGRFSSTSWKLSLCKENTFYSQTKQQH